MKAADLIGKKAIRTAPAGKTQDHSFCSEPITIVYANDTHILYTAEFGLFGDKKVRILSFVFCDNNWSDFSELERYMTPQEPVIVSVTVSGENEKGEPITKTFEQEEI